MANIHKITNTYILGVTLTLLSIPLFIALAPLTKSSEEDSHVYFEFTDVRIADLDRFVSHSHHELVQQVTIHSNFSFNSQWCQWGDLKALPCPRPILGQVQKDAQDQIMTQHAIPLL